MTILRDGRTDPFFDGARRDVLMIRRCAECRHWHAPDATVCAECGGEDLDWAEAEGRALLVSWSKVHRRDGGEPAHIALVELAEGPWLHAALDQVDRPRENLPLRAGFVHAEAGEPHLVFRPL
ncbi:Zn-ribbon domain-containing OB-fold protein [Actinocorallia longicatena]|uniref:Zn-ribbon domain-containing OB-fold protein n=1 Tax=Actinocorallia longicatena TaxID=111803 RepID=A0ABP6QN54_9ACTN